MALLTPVQLRSRVTALADEAKFPDEVLTELVEEFTVVAEKYRGVAYEQRTTVESIQATATRDRLLLTHPRLRSVLALTIDGTAVDVDSLALDKPISEIRYTGGFPRDAEVIVTYTHGLGARRVSDGVTVNGNATLTSATAEFTAEDVDRPVSGTGIPVGTTIAMVDSATSIELSADATATATGVLLTIGAPPALLLRACREYVRACAIVDRGSVGREVIAQADGAGGTTRFSTPDWDDGRPTGWSEVDRLLNTLEDHRCPSVG